MHTTALVLHEIGGVIHFAGLKDVSESQSKPLRYYDNNVIDSITLIEESLKANIEYFVFPSSVKSLW